MTCFASTTFNLDPVTETYGIPYLEYLARWLECLIVAEAPGGELMGYTMGKAEAQWQGKKGMGTLQLCRWNFGAMVWLLNLWSY